VSFFVVRRLDCNLDVVGLLLALAVGAQELFKPLLIVAADQVQYRQSFQVLHGLKAETLQVAGVGVNMHAVMDVGDGIARTVQQLLRAPLRFAQRSLKTSNLAPCPKVAELTADGVLEVRCIGFTDHIHGAHGHDLTAQLGILVLAKDEHGNVFARLLKGPERRFHGEAVEPRCAEE